jgi:hypothetical protein
MMARYHAGHVNHCPSCGRCHWLIGRVTAECGFCATALPLTDSGSHTPRIVTFGNGGGIVRREAA